MWTRRGQNLTDLQSGVGYVEGMANVAQPAVWAAVERQMFLDEAID